MKRLVHDALPSGSWEIGDERLTASARGVPICAFINVEIIRYRHILE